jgi:heat shock protein HtpX
VSHTFHDLIAANRRRSAFLVFAFLLLFIVTLYAVTVALLDLRRPEDGLLPVVVIAILAALIAFWSWYGGAKAILAMSGAREIEKKDDPQLYNVVEELSIAAGLPLPKVYLIEDTALNAFATGRDPRHAVVAITRGLRERLTREELQGVLAHELSHVRNYDIRFGMLLAVLVGLLVLVTDVFRRWLWWGGGRGRRKSGEGGGGGAIMAVVAIAAILLSIIAPILAKLIQLAASREREYLADASAVELTRYPEGLASALEKLGQDQEVLETANRATQHLYIVNPIRKFEKRAAGLLSTHPPLPDRIQRLRALAGTRSGNTR